MKKVILVTGASSGMGKATALQLIKEGNIVYGAARRTNKMKDIENAGGSSIEMDITNDEQVVNAVNKIIKEHGKIDVLVNNAGFAIYGSVEETKIEDAKKQFEVNIFGLARLTQLVIPHMRNQRSGTIINISSMGGKIYTPLGAWYHATKHALEGWSDCLRLETKQFGIDVVIIEPGIITTEFGHVLSENMTEGSAKGPYSKIALSVESALKDSYEKGGGSPSSTISKVISKAINARKPKTRYAAGKMAKPMIFIRKYFGDRIFDKLVMSRVK